jgi:ABC-type multidrug transport system fused ATPase/permease subunit
MFGRKKKNAAPIEDATPQNNDDGQEIEIPVSRNEESLKNPHQTKLTKEELTRAVSFFKLFRFSSYSDLFLVFIACLCSMGNGGSMSAYAILLGRIFDSINSPAGFQVEYSYYLCGIGGAIILLGTFQVGFLTITADRAATNIRKAYLKALLKQDVAFFDAHRSGQLATAIVENTIVHREAIGDKLGQAIQSLTMFAAGVVVGFYYLWSLTLVTLSLSPLLAVAGYFMAKTMRARIHVQLQSYADAGAIADETLSNVRTITSLGAQPIRIEKYRNELAIATKVALKQGVTGGIASGFTFFVFFCSYGISFYAGGTFIANSRTAAEIAYPYDAIANHSAPFCKIGASVPQICNAGNPFDPNSMFLTAADVCSCPVCGCGCYPNPNVYGADAAYSCITGGNILTVFFSVLLGSFGLGQAVG